MVSKKTKCFNRTNKGDNLKNLEGGTRDKGFRDRQYSNPERKEEGEVEPKGLFLKVKSNRRWVPKIQIGLINEKWCEKSIVEWWQTVPIS
jgi:hypothetical protein